MFKRIVVGADGFGPSSKTVTRAAEIAEQSGATLIVVHVHAPYKGGGSGLGRAEREPIDAHVGVLESIEQKFGQRLELRTVLKEGDPAEALIDVAEEEKADLLVVGHVGMNKRIALAAVPNQVSHHAPCNVLIVSSTGSDPVAYKNLLVGVDGSDRSLQAVSLAGQMSAPSGADLLICFAHADDAKAQEVLARAEAKAKEAGATAVRTVAQPGDPSEALLDIAEKESVDLLVVGNKGMTGIRRFMLGSVPNKVSHHSPCDLLIAKTS
jgi:nucleotide-binding universal stress UspA family protein